MSEVDLSIDIPDTVLELLGRTGDDYRELKVYVFQARRVRRWFPPTHAVPLGVGATVLPVRVGMSSHRVYVPISGRGRADMCVLSLGGLLIGGCFLSPVWDVQPGDTYLVRLRLTISL